MIYIQTINKEWSPGSKMLQNQTDQVRKAFELYIAYEFVEEVKNAITTQKYKGKWKPLSPQYLAYKRKKGLSPIIWEATKELKTTLKVMNKKDHIVIGWDKRLLHKSSKKGLFGYKKSKVPIYKIAIALEYGTLKIPPRPLFRLVYMSMSKNIRRYWEKFAEIFLESTNSKYKSIFKKNKRKAFTQYIHDMHIKFISLLQIFKKGGS